MRRFSSLVLFTSLAVGLTACNSDSSSSSAQAAPPAQANRPLNRYEMANACWVLKADANDRYITLGDDGYAASAVTAGQAERFFMKPTALGSYMLYNSNRELMTAEDSELVNVASVNATEGSEWTVRVEGDSSSYPHTPAYHQEPTAEEVALWHQKQNYKPQIRGRAFTLVSEDEQNPENHKALALDDTGKLTTVATADFSAGNTFSLEPASGCAEFPEAQSNFSGAPFKGTQPDGSVLGHADVHVHISATEFLGGAHWGKPFDKFGVEHALGNCSNKHGPQGYMDFLQGAYAQDEDGHATDGWPTFSEWPARDNLTHEAIYWKWIERAWAGGLRVIVNDLVDNETLCELQRNAVGEPNRDCNSMNNAGRQAGTMYAMENYIDAQYGGPGKGFFQIVHTPDEAREVIEDGKIAVVLGIEISNLFDCKLIYSPSSLSRSEQPFEETGAGGQENRYACTQESLVEQMQRAHGWGVRQLISIHEFDNAFGGNGIFDGALLNVGNRENSGGIPSGDMSNIIAAFEAMDPSSAEYLSNLQTTETATGEWWTTYDCPQEGEDSFSGYLWANSGGAPQTLPGQVNQLPGLEYVNILTGLSCTPSGQNGRSGGKTPCYPVAVNQCNARWMTPMGLFAYQKMMEMGFIIDWDHMALGMKTQLLELAEAQNPVYPFASTHGTFGGITNDQATRMIANGGFLYPSNGKSWGFQKDMNETYAIYEQAMSLRGEGNEILFGFGYGTDTNGLSAQSEPRGEYWNNLVDAPDDYVPLKYPFTFFNGAPFDTEQFAGISPVQFYQPKNEDPLGELATKEWDEDEHGNAHYGMLTDFIQEIVLDSPKPQEHIKHLFNSAEAYLQTWERTVTASKAIRTNGIKIPQEQEKPILRAAPNSSPLADQVYGDPTSYCDAIGERC